MKAALKTQHLLSFANQTGVENMGYPSDEVMVGKLEDEEKDWVLGASLLLGGFLAQAHPVEQQRLHGVRKQL